MLRLYSCKAGSRRWPLVCFFNLLDMAALNAYVISTEAGITTCSRRDFLIALSHRLCAPQIAKRTAVSKGIPLLQKLRGFTTLSAASSSSGSGEKTMKCRQCLINKTTKCCCNCKHLLVAHALNSFVLPVSPICSTIDEQIFVSGFILHRFH